MFASFTHPHSSITMIMISLRRFQNYCNKADFDYYYVFCRSVAVWNLYSCRLTLTLVLLMQVVAVLIDNFIKAVSGETQARRPVFALLQFTSRLRLDWLTVRVFERLSSEARTISERLMRDRAFKSDRGGDGEFPSRRSPSSGRIPKLHGSDVMRLDIALQVPEGRSVTRSTVVQKDIQEEEERRMAKMVSMPSGRNVTSSAPHPPTRTPQPRPSLYASLSLPLSLPLSLSESLSLSL
jgi:hypothetical protein